MQDVLCEAGTTHFTCFMKADVLIHAGKTDQRTTTPGGACYRVVQMGRIVVCSADQGLCHNDDSTFAVNPKSPFKKADHGQTLLIRCLVDEKAARTFADAQVAKKEKAGYEIIIAGTGLA